MNSPQPAKLVPDSGQRFKLHGGSGPWEGYLAIRTRKNNPWSYVSTPYGSWSIKEANVVCRHLGFFQLIYLRSD